MPQNGEINEKFGTYKSICCGAEIVIKAGTPFPDCPRHLKLPTIWKLILPEKTVAQDRNKSELKCISRIKRRTCIAPAKVQ